MVLAGRRKRERMSRLAQMREEKLRQKNKKIGDTALSNSADIKTSN